MSEIQSGYHSSRTGPEIICVGDPGVVYKAFFHDLARPSSIRHGRLPVWDGSVPHRLPVVDGFDVRQGIFQAGWHARDTPVDALWQSGLWGDGAPARVFELRAIEGHDVVSEIDEGVRKYASATWLVAREIVVTDRHLRDVSRRLVAPRDVETLAASLSACISFLAGRCELTPPARNPWPAIEQRHPKAAPLAWKLLDSPLDEQEIVATGRDDALCLARDVASQSLLSILERGETKTGEAP